MKAVIYEAYGSPEVLQLTEVAKPVPAENEVLVRIMATTVAATDPISRKGEPFIARAATGLMKPKIPILGDSFAGRIEAIGEAVTQFAVGDEVYGTAGAGSTLNRIGAAADIWAAISFKADHCLSNGTSGFRFTSNHE